MFTTDYHTFTTKDTPEKERRRLNVGDLWINAVKCLGCGETIRSKNRHDYRTCQCGQVSVDGGSMYAKRSFKEGAKWEDLTEEFTDAVVHPS